MEEDKDAIHRYTLHTTQRGKHTLTQLTCRKKDEVYTEQGRI